MNKILGSLALCSFLLTGTAFAATPAPTKMASHMKKPMKKVVKKVVKPKVKATKAPAKM
jgi:hypothetical protein